MAGKPAPDPDWVETELIGGPFEQAKERIDMLLDTLAFLAMAGGVGWGLWRWLGPFAIAIGGALLATLVAVAATARRLDVPVAETEPEPAKPEAPKAPPGPEHEGTHHAKGDRQ